MNHFTGGRICLGDTVVVEVTVKTQPLKAILYTLNRLWSETVSRKSFLLRPRLLLCRIAMSILLGQLIRMAIV